MLKLYQAFLTDLNHLLNGARAVRSFAPHGADHPLDNLLNLLSYQPLKIHTFPLPSKTMTRVEKTAFVCDRRTNALYARAIFQSLTHHGFDVFLDYQEIASGEFEQVILENTRARAHSLLLLTPSALERWDTPGDWLRGEIEEAVETKRNVVPLTKATSLQLAQHVRF